MTYQFIPEAFPFAKDSPEQSSKTKNVVDHLEFVDLVLGFLYFFPLSLPLELLSHGSLKDSLSILHK